jgi:CO/xanthine dehydrogenase FAD-binding subunit
MGCYLRPTELSEALEALGDGPWALLAGGTDFYPARVGRAPDERVLDISAIEGLRELRPEGDHYLIGALATWSDLIRAPLPLGFDGLKAAARQIGGPQIQNAATLCGNICNASPAADAVPPLLTLEATVEIASRGGRRSLPLADFIIGNRRTSLGADELVTGLRVPKPAPGARSAFLKLGARSYLVISIVMVAALVEPGDDGRVAGARLAVGACSPVALCLPELEAALAGRPLDDRLGEVVEPGHLAALTPIDDIRGGADYRLDAAATLLHRALSGLGAELGDAA